MQKPSFVLLPSSPKHRSGSVILCTTLMYNKKISLALKTFQFKQFNTEGSALESRETHYICGCCFIYLLFPPKKAYMLLLDIRQVQISWALPDTKAKGNSITHIPSVLLLHQFIAFSLYVQIYPQDNLVNNICWRHLTSFVS